MPRNFFRRIELMFPVEDARLKARLVAELLPIVLSDNVKARQLGADGAYSRVARSGDEASIRSQTIFQALARESSREAVDSAFRFVPILGPSGAPPVQETVPNGNGAGHTRTKPPRVRGPRARKRTEPA